MKKVVTLSTAFILITVVAYSQTPPGIPELQAARTEMALNANALGRAVFVLGALFGIIGGLRIYKNWNMGRKEVDVQVAYWFGACIFLSVMGIFIKALYNV